MTFKKPTNLSLKYFLVHKELDSLVYKIEFLINGDLLYDFHSLLKAEILS